jgi:hypothetical protein
MAPKNYSWHEYYAKNGKGASPEQSSNWAREARVSAERAQRYLAEAAQAGNPTYRRELEERAAHERDRAEQFDAMATYGDI